MKRLTAKHGCALLCLYLLTAWLALAALVNTPAWAADPDTISAANADALLTKARERIETMRKDLENKPEDTTLVDWRNQALDIQSQANQLAETLEPQLADVTARLEQLGTLAEGQTEAADIAEQRAQLEKTNRALDAQVKLAKLLSIEASQTAEQISSLRRNQFQASLGERRDTVLSRAYWTELDQDLPRDLGRLRMLLAELAQGAAGTPAPVWLLLGAGMTLVLALRIWGGKQLLHLTAEHVPPGRLRRSFLAMAIVALTTAAPGLIGLLLAEGLRRSGTLSEGTESLLNEWVGILCLAGYVAGLGHALLSPLRPSWRLPSIPDAVALGLRWVPRTLAVLVPVMWLATRLPAQLNTGLTTAIALNSVAASLLGAAMLATLVHGERLRRMAALETESGRVPPRPFWISALISAVWVALIVGLISLPTGYSAFGTFLITQVVWCLVVVSSLYLASSLAEDSFMTLLAGRHRDEPQAQPRLRNQAAVLLVGLARVALLLVAIVMLISPFGEGPAELLHRLQLLPQGLQLGQVELRPGVVLQALFVLTLCLIAVRLMKRWLKRSYLPTTQMDPGMQLSASTLFGYAGIVLSIALALSAVGVSLDRVAWIASALSVGIGFGLQAVVQNFVSGLILLAERPVKVGDWVALGGIEGDIQRINVRATEIQMADRSTVIVPNSEFITKTVRNVTHANPLGRVQMRLPLPLETDADKVRALILEAFAAHPEILETPAADVYLDGIENQSLIFNAIGYVHSPRAAYGVRSKMLYDVLQRLRESGLNLAPTTTTVILRGTDETRASELSAPRSMAASPDEAAGQA